MTTLKPYPAYKESSLDWSGRVPEHWDLVQLARLADERKVRNVGLHETTVLSLSYGRIIVKTDIYAGLSPADFSTYQIVEPGNVILRLTDLQNDQRSLRVGLAEMRGIITSAYVCLKPSEFMVPRFLYRMLHDFDVKKMFYGMGAGVRQGLSYKELRKTVFAIPPLDEQRAIADFLDGMDARITRFIAARRKMIALLEEKKQAVIYQAVTRGLDPSVPMKDSGVDWLGEIPAHWDVRKVSQLFPVSGSGTTPPSGDRRFYENGNIPWVITGDLNDNTVANPNKTVSQLAVNAYPSLRLYPAGSLVIAMYGATIGKTGLLEFDATVNQACFVLSPSTRMLSRLAQSQFVAFKKHLINFGVGGGQPNINSQIIKSFQLAVPPASEQRQLMNHIDLETLRIDNLVSRHRREIELMQEYRTRLISDVVTGKLDVRGVELPAVEEVIGEEIEAAMEDDAVEDAEVSFVEG